MAADGHIQVGICVHRSRRAKPKEQNKIIKTDIFLALGVLAAVCAGTPLMAAHANPWAESTDTVLGVNHDTNQERSENTPGEDEIRGVMTRSAHGKLGTTPAGDEVGGKSAAGVDAGAHGRSGQGSAGGETGRAGDAGRGVAGFGGHGAGLGGLGGGGEHGR